MDIAFSKLTGYVGDDEAVRMDQSWFEKTAATAEASQVKNPLTGGSDPLHLSIHSSGPLEDVRSKPRILRSGTTEAVAVLSLDSMTGWYRALVDAGASLPDIGQRSWRVDVVVKQVGFLGTFRRSRVSSIWFSGRHEIHARGI
jgi:hypothetical protein